VVRKKKKEWEQRSHEENRATLLERKGREEPFPNDVRPRLFLGTIFSDPSLKDLASCFSVAVVVLYCKCTTDFNGWMIME